MKCAPLGPGAGPSVPRATPHGLFFNDDVADGREHGERTHATPPEDGLIGTAGSHTPAPDARAEEPYGEIAASADNEGGGDGGIDLRDATATARP